MKYKQKQTKYYIVRNVSDIYCNLNFKNLSQLVHLSSIPVTDNFVHYKYEKIN